jgi:hypothetical protein
MAETKHSSISRGGVWLLFHGGFVAALTAFLLATEWLQPDDTPDANIGGGMAFLVLLVMGLPWSLPAWFDHAWGLRIAFAVAGAGLNVVVHAAVWAGVRRRRRVRGGLRT